MRSADTTLSIDQPRCGAHRYPLLLIFLFPHLSLAIEEWPKRMWAIRMREVYTQVEANGADINTSNNVAKLQTLHSFEAF